jgi:hypothetical protein
MYLNSERGGGGGLHEIKVLGFGFRVDVVVKYAVVSFLVT